MKTQQVYNFFGYKRQRIKLKEEMFELLRAYAKYILKPNKHNACQLMDECNDVGFLISQIALGKHNISIAHQKNMKDYKTNRTLRIIKDCDGNPDNYNKIRRQI